MNGNFVLIPESAVRDIGINDPVFRHSMGDIDYGLRARKAGYAILQAPKAAGFQNRNPINYSRLDRNNFSSLKVFLTSPKGKPPREWWHFCRRHGGLLWIMNFCLMYARPAIALLSSRVRS
jgi:GT2 family glycosyltransferase